MKVEEKIKEEDVHEIDNLIKELQVTVKAIGDKEIRIDNVNKSIQKTERDIYKIKSDLNLLKEKLEKREEKINKEYKELNENIGKYNRIQIELKNGKEELSELTRNIKEIEELKELSGNIKIIVEDKIGSAFEDINEIKKNIKNKIEVQIKDIEENRRNIEEMLIRTTILEKKVNYFNGKLNAAEIKIIETEGKYIEYFNKTIWKYLTPIIICVISTFIFTLIVSK